MGPPERKLILRRCQDQGYKSGATQHVWGDPSSVSKKMWAWKTHLRTLIPMHWHPSHATNSAASPSRCLWSINNKIPNLSLQIHQTIPRLRLWERESTGFSHTPQAHSPPESRANYELIWAPAVGLLSPQESSVTYGDHEGNEWARVLLTCWRHHVTVMYCLASRLCENGGQRSHEFIRSVWSKCGPSMF